MRQGLAVTVVTLGNFEVELMEERDLVTKRNVWCLNHAENDQGLSTACRYEAGSGPPTVSDNVSWGVHPT